MDRRPFLQALAIASLPTIALAAPRKLRTAEILCEFKEVPLSQAYQAYHRERYPDVRLRSAVQLYDTAEMDRAVASIGWIPEAGYADWIGTTTEGDQHTTRWWYDRGYAVWAPLGQEPPTEDEIRTYHELHPRGRGHAERATLKNPREAAMQNTIGAFGWNRLSPQGPYRRITQPIILGALCLRNDVTFEKVFTLRLTTW